MKFNSFVCCCLLLAAALAEENADDWSWGEKIKDASSPVIEKSSSREGHSRENKAITADIQASTSDIVPVEVTESSVSEVLPLETQSSENEQQISSETEVTLPPNEENRLDSTKSETQNDDSQLLETERKSTNGTGSLDHELSSLETKSPSSEGSDLIFPTGEPLPLEPHEPSPELSEGVDKDGLQTPQEGVREGRFINIGETLCSYGIGFNCEPKTSPPFKSHYGSSKLDKNQLVYAPSVPVNIPYGYQQYPAGYIPTSQSLPYPSLPFNRNGNVVTTTEASSIFDGILSALEPILPASKPEAPPRVSKGGIHVPSLPSYERPPPPYYPPVNPSYVNPQPSYVASPPAYIPVKNPYEVPQQSFATPVYDVSKPEYQDVSQSHYVVPQETYITPQRSSISTSAEQFNQNPAVPVALSTAESQDTYIIPQRNFITTSAEQFNQNPAVPGALSTAESQVTYITPQRNFIEPNNAQVSYTQAVPLAPSAVEEHQHSHTHIYDKQNLPRDIYKNDHHGLLQSVHDSINQMNEFSKPHRDFHRVSNHVDGQHDFQAAQSSVSNVIHRQRPVTAPSTTSINPSILSGGSNFLPGKIERGFKPIPTSSDHLFRQREAVFSEDCQCVAVAYCSEQDVVNPNVQNELRNIIDARNTGINILSNSTNTHKNASVFIQNSEIAGQSSARRGKVLALRDDNVDFAGVTESVLEETTEATTEEVTDAWIESDEQTGLTESVLEETTEATIEEVTEAWRESGEQTTVSPFSEESLDRVRRQTSEEENASDEVSSDRQGRQLTGFTPGNNGCGLDYVCCRRPVFRARQQTVGLQPKYTCGKRNADGLLGRVKSVQSSPSDTEFGEYPWQAAILKRENGDLLYVCGGTLINNKYVLTAAHCVNGIHPSLLMIRLGEWDASGETEFYNHVEYRSSGVYLHPEFSAGNLQNDIAVISLENLVDFVSNPHISPICLPGKFAEFTNRRCFATGWGKDAFGTNGKFSPILRAVEVPVIESQRCQQALQSTRLGRTFSLPEGNLCAGGEENKDTCKGDGGGPLVCSGSDGSMQLAGLVSWGIGCGQPGVPGVYVKVSHYLDWIKDITRSS